MIKAWETEKGKVYRPYEEGRAYWDGALVVCTQDRAQRKYICVLSHPYPREVGQLYLVVRDEWGDSILFEEVHGAFVVEG